MKISCHWFQSKKWFCCEHLFMCWRYFEIYVDEMISQNIRVYRMSLSYESIVRVLLTDNACSPEDNNQIVFHQKSTTRPYFHPRSTIRHVTNTIIIWVICRDVRIFRYSLATQHGGVEMKKFRHTPGRLIARKSYSSLWKVASPQLLWTSPKCDLLWKFVCLPAMILRHRVYNENVNNSNKWCMYT